MNQISFVVDNLASHYYQAELLLYSLEKNSNYQKKDIVVQCLNRVDDEFLNYLIDNGYTYNLIEPYLDGKYCNKLMQLEYFRNKNIDGVILMDTDMFVLDDLSQIKGDKIMAKRVDAPNPALSTLENIYKAASLKLPTLGYSDWVMPNNATFKNNFNGGFYYIPQNLIETMSKDWKKWADWLYNRPQLFSNPQQFIHVDQISFSLAIHANRFPFTELTANYNFPIHSAAEICSFENSENIKIIHYHREIDDFGLLDSTKTMDKGVIKAIDSANDSIIQKDEMVFFKQYKKSLTPTLRFSKKAEEFRKKLKVIIDNKRYKLVLHAGTPKTGTTSLQSFLNTNNKILQEEGYLYSQINLHPSPSKHQWIVSNLLSENFDELIENFEKVYQEAVVSDCHTIILSTEGIYNHWWDYSYDAKLILNVLSEFFNISIWIFFRNPQSFMQSFYKQNLKNPQLESVSCYGKNISLEEMLRDRWFYKHLDYLEFIYECELLFSEKSIKVFTYSKDIIKDVCTELGVNIEHKETHRENVGFSSLSIEILRVINQYNLSASDKSKILIDLSQCDSILQKYSSAVRIESKSISDRFYLQNDILKKEYGLCF